MTATIPLIRCGFGLGNRVAAIAHGLTMFDMMEFAWRVNDQCPASHRDIFPDGITGVEFIDNAPIGYASKMNGKRIHDCDFLPSSDKKRSAFRTVIEAMTGDAYHRPQCAIVARFHRFPINPKESSETLAGEAARLNVGSCFILADSHRSTIAEALVRNGIDSIFPESPEMTRDMDRDAEGVVRFCSDWKTALSAKHILSVGGKSSLLFPYPLNTNP